MCNLKAEGHLEDDWIRVRMLFNRLIPFHEYRLAGKGKRLLREGGTVLRVLRRDGALLA